MQSALGADAGQRLARPRHAEGDGAVAADGGDGLGDLLALGCGQVLQAGLDAGDKGPDPDDFLGGGDGLGPCPLVDLGRGEHPFPVAADLVRVAVLAAAGVVVGLFCNLPLRHAGGRLVRSCLRLPA